MSNGPGKRNPTGPFRLVNVEAERLSGTVPAGTQRPEEEPVFELETPPATWRDDVLESLEELKSGQAKLFVGQTELSQAFGGVKAEVAALIPRVQKLEAAARWKVWALRVGKAAIPLLAAVLGRYAPELAKHLPDLLELFAKVAADAPI
jgi:hypothetical protein